MIYNDSYQKKLEAHLNKNFAYYKKKGGIDESIMDYILNNKNFMSDIPRLNIIEIDNHKATVPKENLERFKNHNNDKRLSEYLSMINNALKWAKKNNYKVPKKTKLHLLISDKSPFMKEKKYNFPLFVMTKFKDIPFNLFPDNTFECLTLDKKYSNNCYNWDEMKEIITDNSVDMEDKKNIIYFKGTDTTKQNHNIRYSLSKHVPKLKSVKTIKRKINAKKSSTMKLKLKKPSDNKIKLVVKLDAWVNYEPIYNFSSYKILLNLPGRYPWSNRLKYLPLMNSHIIDVNIITHYENNQVDKSWITFINIIFDNIKHNFNSIDYHYYDANKYTSTKKELAKNKKLNLLSYKKFTKAFDNKINDIILNPKKYNKIIEKNNELINELTNERIYQYICYALKLNAQYF